MWPPLVKRSEVREPPARSNDDGELHALLVGIDRYRPQRLPDGGRIPDLQACTNDVERMGAFLRAEPLRLPSDRIKKLVSPPSAPSRARPLAEDLPTYSNIVRALEALCERPRKGDRVLVHYSGHGASLPTVVPEKKGTLGKDEALVPCDAGAPDGGFLRDVELHEVLRRLAARGIQATLILDCCHSGGLTRELPTGNVRGLGEVAVEAPAESLLGSWEELAAAYPERATGAREVIEDGFGRPAGETTRHLVHSAGWFPQPEGCVLLAACRPTELAREYPFDGGWSGALTHFLLESVGDLGSRPTYRWLHHRLLGRIRGLFDTQTPLLEGDGDLLFLGRESWPARRGIAVLAVEGEGAERKVQVAAGRAQGLGNWARLALAGRDGDAGRGAGAGGTEREAEVELEIVELGASTSRARPIGNGAGTAPVEAGDLAVVVHPGEGAGRYPVVVRRSEGPDDDHGELLERLAVSLEDGTEPLLALAVDLQAAATEPAFQVEVTPNRSLQILDPSGEPIPHQGQAIPAADPGAVERLLGRLAHLASYKERERLDNPHSPLAGRLRVELYSLDCIDDWQDLEARKLIPEGATVLEGTLLCLLVRNETGRELSFAVLDLQPDWGITQVHPGPAEGHYSVLQPNQAHPVFLKAGLPTWIQEGRDLLKVIATTGALDATSLELDALGESHGYRSFASGGGGPHALREQLLRPVDSVGGCRTMDALTTERREWAVETVEAYVVSRQAQGRRRRV